MDHEGLHQRAREHGVNLLVYLIVRAVFQPFFHLYFRMGRIGTEDVRKGWRIRPRKVRIRAGRPLSFPRAEKASPQLAGAVTDRIWPCVMLQWEWLGGLAPIRRAAIIGAGSWGTSLAITLANAGLEVDLGCRTQEQADEIKGTGKNARYLPDELPEQIRPLRAAELALGHHDL